MLNEIRTLRWWDGAVVVSVIVAGLGLAATTGVTAVFWRHNNTPVVKVHYRLYSRAAGYRPVCDHQPHRCWHSHAVCMGVRT